MRDPFGRPRRGHHQRQRTTVEQPAEHLGEAQVVARRDAQPVVHDDVGARRHQLGLALTEAEEVDLAVGREHAAVGAEQDGGVEHPPGVVALHERAHVHHRAEVGGRSGQRLQTRSGGGLGLLLPPVVGEAALRPELRQHDEVGAGLRADQARHSFPALVRRLVVAVGELDQVDAQPIFHAPTLPRPDPMIVSGERPEKRPIPLTIMALGGARRLTAQAHGSRERRLTAHGIRALWTTGRERSADPTRWARACGRLPPVVGRHRHYRRTRRRRADGPHRASTHPSWAMAGAGAGRCMPDHRPADSTSEAHRWNRVRRTVGLAESHDRWCRLRALRPAASRACHCRPRSSRVVHRPDRDPSELATVRTSVPGRAAFHATRADRHRHLRRTRSPRRRTARHGTRGAEEAGDALATRG